MSKADRPDADRTVADLKQMLALALDSADRAVPVIATSAASGEGIGDLLAEIDSHRRFLAQDGRLARRRRRNVAARTIKIAEDIIRRRHAAGGSPAMNTVIDRVCARELDPHGAALALLAASDEVAP